MEKSIFQLPRQVWKAANFYKKSQFWNADELHRYQKEKLRRLLIHCGTNVPYYKKLFAGIGFQPETFNDLAELSQIPTLDKETVRKNPEEFLATNARKFGITWDSTSGSSGKPLHFVLSDAVQANKIAALLRCYGWAGYRLGMKTFSVQSYYFPDADFKFNRLYNILRFDSNRLSRTSALAVTKAYNRFRPGFVMGFPFDILMIARFATEAGIPIHSPRAILTYGETLSSPKLEQLQQLFRCPVFNFFSLHESSAMIGQCEKGNLHLIDDFAYHELSGDGKNKKLVGTSYYNYSMPLLRYEIGDDILPAAEVICSCGRPFPVIKQIQGKACDYLQTPDGRIMGAVMSHAIDQAKGVICSQIIQEATDQILVNVVGDESYNNDSQTALEKGLRKRVGNDMKIRFQRVTQLEKRPGGKTPFILSHLGNDYE